MFLLLDLTEMSTKKPRGVFTSSVGSQTFNLPAVGVFFAGPIHERPANSLVVLHPIFVLPLTFTIHVIVAHHDNI